MNDREIRICSHVEATELLRQDPEYQGSLPVTHVLAKLIDFHYLAAGLEDGINVV